MVFSGTGKARPTSSGTSIYALTDVVLRRKNKLNFKQTSKVQDRQWESTFEGTVKRHMLSGTFTIDRGEIETEGTLFSAALIGKWNLEITSDRGIRTQILKINPDLSSMYGPIAIQKVHLDDSQVSFKTILGKSEFRFTRLAWILSKLPRIFEL